MRIHARGLELVVELLEAADHIEQLAPQEHRALLQEASQVMGELLARDVPLPAQTDTALTSSNHDFKVDLS